MINLRYHIVSLVAVFLALALGIVMGSTVLKEGTISVLRATTNQIESSNRAYRAENDELRTQVGRLRDFGQAVLPELVGGRLRGRPVVLVELDRAGDKPRGAVRLALEQAGAELEGRVTFSADRLELAEEGDRTALGGLLGAGDGDPGRLRAVLVERLAARLAAPGRLPQDDGGRRGDLVTGLDQAGFLTVADLPEPSRRGAVPFPRAGSLFVLIGPTDGSGTGTAEEFLVELADRLANRSSAPVAAVESAEGPSSWVERLRAEGTVAGRVLTVDAVDLVPGQVALVWALQRRLDGQAAGHYGTKRGSQALVPERSGT